MRTASHVRGGSRQLPTWVVVLVTMIATFTLNHIVDVMLMADRFDTTDRRDFHGVSAGQSVEPPPTHDSHGSVAVASDPVPNADAAVVEGEYKREAEPAPEPDVEAAPQQEAETVEQAQQPAEEPQPPPPQQPAPDQQPPPPQQPPASKARTTSYHCHRIEPWGAFGDWGWWGGDCCTRVVAD